MIDDLLSAEALLTLRREMDSLRRGIYLEPQLRREQAAIAAIHAKPWWRIGVLLRRPWRAPASVKNRGACESFLKWISDWFLVIHDCQDPAVACSCSGGFRFPNGYDFHLWHDGYDWVIALDEKDADLAWQEHVGDPREPGAEPWHEQKTGGRFDLDDGRGLREMTLSEILAHGRGFFASVNQ